tara:strand:+ start:749 stop:1426 length:678 start_codon:yes stop_codon:yes gene_type:complete
MKLKEIIKASNWEAVRKAFLRIYPSQKKSIIGYEIVHKKLRAKPTTISTMKLCCDNGESILKGDDQFHDIYGIDGTKREDGELEKFSLSLTPWSQWLGSSLSEKILNNYTKEEIISHCLFDMTFHGFSEAEIKNVKKELNTSMKDSQDPIRYIIVANFLYKAKWQYYFNVSDETWCNEINSATTFKRKNHALAILKTLNRGKDKSNIMAKITTKNEKRKVLKYFK